MTSFSEIVTEALKKQRKKEGRPYTFKYLESVDIPGEDLLSEQCLFCAKIDKSKKYRVILEEMILDD